MSRAGTSFALTVTLAVAVLGACSKDRSKGATPDAGAVTSAVEDAASDMLSPEEGMVLVKGACLSCHSMEMLAQQRLTLAQWTKSVTKMVGWGANLEPKDTEPLTRWLAATYGPDAGPWDLLSVDAVAARAEIAPLADGPYANGDPERGRALYTDKCSGCHGPDARGHIGVRLVDRPFLYRAEELAETVRRGRGKMTPIAMSDAELADTLAHLRRLR